MRPRTEHRSRTWLRLRIWMLAGCFAVGCFVLLSRAVQLQVIDHDMLTNRARGEFLKSAQLAPRRGIIFDRHLEELAVSLDTDSVYASPLKITTPRGTGRALGKALSLPPNRVSRWLKGEKGFVWVARRISPQKAEKVRALKLEGVGILSEPRRFYPHLELAAHVLGFAGMDSVGLAGLELTYDSVLKGRTQNVVALRDALGRTIHPGPGAQTELPQGLSLILTLDKNLQYQTEKILSETVKQHRAKAGVAVVMAPSTGEILAMAAFPSFNPNIFNRYPASWRRNRITGEIYEPGSTLKVFTAAAALASRKVSLNQKFYCEKGSWAVGGRVIHDTHKHENLDLAEILKLSSNIGAAKVAQRVGAQDLYRTLVSFGFGRPCGIDLPGEEKGLLRNFRTWRPLELANISFGQGVAVTPLQLTTAVAAVANGGVLMRPYVVRALVDKDGGLARETQPLVRARAMGVRESRILTRMMTRVTEKGGTGTKARVAPFTVAGKTGTAQKVVPGGGYSHEDYMSSFVGFLPAEAPRAAILVVIDSPRGQYHGGSVAAPAWARIARAALGALGIKAASRHPQQAGKPQAQPLEPGPAPRIVRLGGWRKRQLAKGRAPDMTGCTLGQVLEVVRGSRLSLRVQGWGRVAAQSPAPGRPLAHRLSLRLSPTGGDV